MVHIKNISLNIILELKKNVAESRVKGVASGIQGVEC